MIGKIDYSNYFEDLFNKILKPLWCSRNQSHGNSWAGRTGPKGIFCQIERKTDRLFNSIWKGDLNSEDNLEVAKDQAKDLAVYSMALFIALDFISKKRKLNYNDYEE